MQARCWAENLTRIESRETPTSKPTVEGVIKIEVDPSEVCDADGHLDRGRITKVVKARIPKGRRVHVVVVQGGTGLGKTHFAGEIAASVRAREGRVVGIAPTRSLTGGIGVRLGSPGHPLPYYEDQEDRDIEGKRCGVSAVRAPDQDDGVPGDVEREARGN